MTPFLALTAVAVAVHLGMFGFGPPLSDDQAPQPHPMQVPSGPKPPPSAPPPGSSAPAQPAPTTPPPTAKPAPTSISADLWILHGTNDNSGIDPKLGKMPALSKPPFSSYNSYKLIGQAKQSLAKGTAVPYTLPTGRELRIVYKDVLQPQKQGDPLRYVITASIQKPDGKSFLPLVEVSAQAGEMFFVGGQEFKGGSLFIGIKVGP
jgi:hypothetical protein